MYSPGGGTACTECNYTVFNMIQASCVVIRHIMYKYNGIVKETH